MDAVDLRQALAMGGRISEERDRERSSRDKPQPQTPTSFSFEKGKQKEDKDEGLLKGWKLSADLGDMSDLRGAVAGLGSLILDDGGGTVKGRPRAHSEMVPMEQQLKPPLPHSKSTPTTPILSSDISDADAAGRSSMSDATAMPSDRNTPDPSDASDYDTAPQSASSSKFTSSVPQWSPTSRDTLHVQPPQRRAGPGGSLNAGKFLLSQKRDADISFGLGLLTNAWLACSFQMVRHQYVPTARVLHQSHLSFPNTSLRPHDEVPTTLPLDKGYRFPLTARHHTAR